MPDYDSYQRSTAVAPFDDYSLDNGMIAWIDILGVRSATHQQIVTAVKKVLDLAAEFSATGPIVNGVMYGTPQSALQYALVGDALVLVEKNQPDTPAASKLALVWRICELSARLFDEGLIHRGAVTFGAVECFKADGVHVITGSGVVRAVALESSIKCTGLFFDEKCVPILQERQTQLARRNQVEIVFKRNLPSCLWFFAARYMSGIVFAGNGGYQSWNQALIQARPHKYIKRSKRILSHIKRT